MRLSKRFFLIPILSGLLLACNPVKHIPEGKSLLVKNVIRTDTSIIPNERFEKLLKQKPNRKFLGLIRFHLGVYNWGSSGKETDFKRKLRNIGEEPVLLDSELTARSVRQLELFLHKNGFFNAVVTDSIRINKKKSKVEYYIAYHQPYTYRYLNYTTQDSGIYHLMPYFKENSLLIPGQRYNEDDIEKERERITADLKDRGYYFFNKNFITFQIDSSLGTHQTDVNLYLNRVNENVGTGGSTDAPIIDHQTFRLRNIFVQTDFNPKNPANSIPHDSTLYNGYYILSNDSVRVLTDDVIVRNLFIKPGDKYLQRDLDLSYKRLQELNVFKFINLNFTEVPRDATQTEYLLDLNILLTPMDKQDFTIESEVTNTGSNIGLAGSVGYKNKNTFRGAEVFELRFKGGLENIPSTTTQYDPVFLGLFNTYEFGPEASFSLKRWPFNTSRYSNPRTTFNLGYNQQNSPDYDRSITNFSMSLYKEPTRRQRLTIYPFDISSVRVNLSPQFAAQLDDLNDPQLEYAYETHLITAFRINWSTTSQSSILDKDFVFFSPTFEIAGKVFNTNIQPSQYVKVNYDFSDHKGINKFNNLITHLTMGVGVPFKESPSLPFEKSFFAGGSNSMRAWYARTLGPGSYKKTIDIEQTGDIKLEANIEYRSEIFEFANGIKLEGAAFVDIGNIWTLNEDVSRPGGKFGSDAFSELGVGSGLGLRFNFSFFIFRFDAAVKLRDPALDKSERWVYPNQKFVIGDITPSIAIGYPF